MSNTKITIETRVRAPLEKVWEMWTKPEHVMAWNQASPDWHCPKGESDLREGGRFAYRMEARDGSEGFDFAGTYTEIAREDFIAFMMDDGRTVEVSFEDEGNGSTHITETFEAETENPVELQKEGWQSILESFKRYVEAGRG